MEKVHIGLIGIAGSLALLGLRVPIGVALALVAFVGVGIVLNWNVAFWLLSNIYYTNPHYSQLICHARTCCGHP